MNEAEAKSRDHPIKRTIADSVFTNLFGIKKYLLQFYMALHPGESDITEDDFTIVTIANVLTDGQYNDLGATVRGEKIIFLCEAQNTWKPERAYPHPHVPCGDLFEVLQRPRYRSLQIEARRPAKAGALRAVHGREEEQVNRDFSQERLFRGCKLPHRHKGKNDL